MPMFLAVGVVTEGVFLLFLMLCIGAGDILLDFALEDARFFELATRCHALSIFDDTEFVLHQSVDLVRKTAGSEIRRFTKPLIRANRSVQKGAGNISNPQC